MDIDEFSFDVFLDGVVTELDVANGTCSSIFTPLYTCHVVVKYIYWFG